MATDIKVGTADSPFNSKTAAKCQSTGCNCMPTERSVRMPLHGVMRRGSVESDKLLLIQSAV